MPPSGSTLHESDAAAVVKAPPWHGWITADLLLSSLSAGVFAVSALCDLVAPETYRAVIRVGYRLAFPLAVLDLACLVMDLGDPLRFQHMLRMFKPRSPMSVGTWSTGAFAAFAAAAWLLAFRDSASLEPVRQAVALLGLPPALLVGAYKGVLLSSTAQPGWRDARWLGATLSISSGALGTALLLVVAAIVGAPNALGGLCAALIALLALNFAAILMVTREMRAALASRFTPADLDASWNTMIAGGVALPLVLLLFSFLDPEDIAVVASAATLLGALVFRRQLVMIPHRPADSRRAAEQIAGSVY